MSTVDVVVFVVADAGVIIITVAQYLNVFVRRVDVVRRLCAAQNFIIFVFKGVFWRRRCNIRRFLFAFDDLHDVRVINFDVV